MPEVTAPAPAGAPAPAAAAAPPPAEPSLLASVTDEPDLSKTIPEKFHVKGADGKLDVAASVAKAEEHRAHLEKRAGTGDLPPKTADDYTITVPEELKAAFDPAKDPLLGEFRAEAHKRGLTQGQFDFVLAEFFKRVPQLGDQLADHDRAKAEAEVRAEWKDEPTFQKNLVAARRAVVAYAGKDADTVLARYGNDATFVRMFAKIGAEMKEDKGVPGDAGLGDLDFGKRAIELRTEIVKLPKGDPRRVAMQAELDGLYARRYPNKVA
jgi:hypothetical protein